MRRSLLIPAVAASLVPAAAAARAQDQGRAGQLADTLHDPAAQIAVTAVLASLSKSLLDLRVGDLARSVGEAAADPDLASVPPQARVRDLAGPDAERMERSIARKTPRMMAAAGNVAEAFENMMPQLRAMAKQMRSALARY